MVIVLGMLTGAATAALFGLFAIHAAGVYFLMITLALGMCVWGLAYRWNSLTGGDNGIVMPPRPAFGIQLADDVTFFFVVFGFFAATLAALLPPRSGRRSGAASSASGRTSCGCASSDTTPGCTSTSRSSSPALSAGSRACCGRTRTASSAPRDVVLATSVDALLMVVLGGPGTLVGGAIGAAIVVFLREYLSTLVPWWQYVLGGVYVLTILYLPGRLMSIPERIRRRRAEGQRRFRRRRNQRHV